MPNAYKIHTICTHTHIYIYIYIYTHMTYATHIQHIHETYTEHIQNIGPPIQKHINSYKSRTTIIEQTCKTNASFAQNPNEIHPNLMRNSKEIRTKFTLWCAYTCNVLYILCIVSIYSTCIMYFVRIFYIFCVCVCVCVRAWTCMCLCMCT